MCTVVVLYRPEHAWPLILGANRDEMIDRPWDPPGRHWPDRAEVVAGRDRLAGGTWLGANDHGVVAAVLNRIGTLGPAAGHRSRGELPLEALDHADAAAAAEALAHIEPAAYRPFNMIIGDNRDVFWLKGDGGPVQVERLAPGVSMVTAHDRNDRGSARIRAYLPRFEAAPPPDPDADDWAAWEMLLSARLHDAGIGGEGAMCVLTERGFETVSSSLIAVPAPAAKPRPPLWRFCAGRPGEAPFVPVEA